MKLLSISTALTALILTTTAFALEPMPELKITDSNEVSETLSFNKTKLIRSKKAFETREAAQAFCKTQKTELASYMDILATIMVNNDREGKEIHAGLNDTASFLLLDTASGQKASGFISWVSDSDLRPNGAIIMDSDIVIIEDGKGGSGYLYQLKELKRDAIDNGASLDKTALVAFCKK